MPADLKELRRLHEAATPGPWKAHTPEPDEDGDGDWGSDMSISMGSYRDDSACYRTVDLIEAYANFYPDDAEYEEAVANVQLIAAARNALPSLLDRIETLEAENARLRGILDLSRHKVHEHLPSRVLALLHNQQISMGKACEWLRDYANGKQGPLTDAELVDTAELEADRERLEWLEQVTVHQATVPQFWRNRNGKVSFAPYDEAKCFEADSVREAIDAAREAANG